MGLGLALGLLMGTIGVYRSILAGGALTIPRLDVGLLAFAVPLALVVAGEEFFFRGWFRACLEPALGVVPATLIAALAYAAWPIAFLLHGAASSFVQTPIGLVTLSGGDLLILFVVALFLNVAFRITGSLWASGLANYLSRFALAFVAAPADFNAGSPFLVLVVSLTLWAVVLLYSRHWARAADRASRPQS
jgi:membrane protease YdiL (CAAX protease family)